MNRLPIVSTLLLVPPISIRITKLALNSRRVYVSAILDFLLSAVNTRNLSFSLPFLDPRLQSIHNRVSYGSKSVYNSTGKLLLLTKLGYSGPVGGGTLACRVRCCPSAERATAMVARRGRTVAICLESIWKQHQ